MYINILLHYYYYYYYYYKVIDGKLHIYSKILFIPNLK
jgi:hypothetical protein